MRKIESKQIRNAARDKPCSLNIVGVCQSFNEATVLAHLPDESNGMGTKSDDLSACFACDSCHAVIDGRMPWPEGEKEHKDWYMRRAQTRTLRVLVNDNIIHIKGANQ